jgi:SynChlorMet cassette radical SAM/SPASM protein ScmF
MSCEIDKSTIQAAEQMAGKLDLPEGVPPLTSLYMYISGSCNLACRHCWIEPEFQAGGNGGQHIPVEYVRKAVREAKPLGLRSVKLTGGEPMLHPRFREIVTLLNEEGLSINIETNGTLLDPDMAAFLKQAKHVFFMSVSVDGANAKTHEDMRCVKGSFKSAISGIKNLVEQGLRPQLICTLHRGNVSQMEKVVELGASLGCGSIKFNHVQQVGRGQDFAAKQGLKVPEIINLHERIENELVKKHKIRIHFDIPFAFYSIRKLLNDSLGRCTVMNILGMLAGGQLSLCGIGVTTPELIYGYIEKDKLREVWCNSPGLALLREQIPERFEGICGKCIHRDFCMGSCVANNFSTSGKLNAPYYFCRQAENLQLFPSHRIK